MTEFTSPSEFRADLQRQFDAFDDLLRGQREAIVQTERERELIAAQIVAVDLVMAMQQATDPSSPTFGASASGDWRGEEWVRIYRCNFCGNEQEGRDPAFCQVCKQPNRGAGTMMFSRTAPRAEWQIAERGQPAPNAQKIAEQLAPRQRQDVRGPVLALIRNSDNELSADQICALLPDLNPPSVRAALKAAVRMGTITEEGGLYFIPGRLYQTSAPPTPEAAPARDGDDTGLPSDNAVSPVAADDRQGGDSDRHLVEPAVPMMRHTFDWEPDPRTMKDASHEEQARALRAAVERAGPAGLDEDNACVEPIVIAAAIEAGWLNRTEDDRGVRLWISEEQEAK